MDSKLGNHRGPLLASLERRLFLKRGLSLGALSLLSGCDLTYDDNVQKYEHDLKVPYYLLFQPDVQELTLYRHTGRKYVSVKPNAAERYAIHGGRRRLARHCGRR